MNYTSVVLLNYVMSIRSSADVIRPSLSIDICDGSVILIFAVESKVSDGCIVNVYETAIALTVDTLGVIDIDWKLPAVGVYVIPVSAYSIMKPSGS